MAIGEVGDLGKKKFDRCVQYVWITSNAVALNPT
jgi:hypothetical protein